MISRLPMILFLLLIAVGFSGWFALRTFFQSIPTPDASLADAIAENVVATRFDTDGKLQTKLAAPKVTHFQKGNSALVSKPHLVVYDEKGEPWTITADYAKTFKGSDSIELIGNVMIHQPMGKDNSEITLKTKELMFYPKKAMAETQEHVYFYGESKDHVKVSVQGKGARFSQKTGIIELFSQMEGQYEPKPKHKTSDKGTKHELRKN